MLLLLLVALIAAAAVRPTVGDAPFELVLGLPLQRLDELEAKFWAISDPQHAEYLQHMTLPELRELIGASATDVTAAKGWLTKLGASRCTAVVPVLSVVRAHGARKRTPHTKWAGRLAARVPRGARVV